MGPPNGFASGWFNTARDQHLDGHDHRMGPAHLGIKFLPPLGMSPHALGVDDDSRNLLAGGTERGTALMFDAERSV